MRRIRVRLQPKASRNEIAGWVEDPGSGEQILQVRVTAPPVDGEANKALVKLLSRDFKVAKSRIKITHGEGSRDKIVEIPNNAEHNIER